LLAKQNSLSWRSPNLPQLKPCPFADEPIVHHTVPHENHPPHDSESPVASSQ